jgi:hypothetical protein
MSRIFRVYWTLPNESYKNVRKQISKFKMGDQEAEKIIHTIKLTQKLRASVTKVFTELSNGLPSSKEDEKETLSDLQKSLLSVNDNLR